MSEPLPFAREALPWLSELRSVARRYAGGRGDLADDLVQETFMRALAAAARYRAGSNARALLHAILVNAARTHFRRDRRDLRLRDRYALEPTIAREIESPANQAGVTGREAGAPLSELVAALPPPFRAVVEQVDLEGRSYREVAARLGCPVGTVMSRLHRARRRLRRKVEAGRALRDGTSGPVRADLTPAPSWKRRAAVVAGGSGT